MRPDDEGFDVFLCHKAVDKSEVEEIAARLRRRGLRPWLANWELRPGLPWQQEIQHRIENIGAGAVFLGPSGRGPWQKVEIESLHNQFVKRRIPVIPVLLPGTSPSEVPPLLQTMTWVDFNTDSPDPLERLIWGIVGKKPLFQEVQTIPLFISYSRSNSPFVDAIEKRLIKDDIRFWRDVHDMKAGRMEKQIDRAIRAPLLNVLLVLSKSSVKSDWVEWELRQARELEKKRGCDVLCPVALDDAWKTCDWFDRIKINNVLDFSNWQDKAAMDRQYRKLVDGIHLFYERGKPNST